jgi:hypothetical protein
LVKKDVVDPALFVTGETLAYALWEECLPFSNGSSDGMDRMAFGLPKDQIDSHKQERKARGENSLDETLHRKP